MFKCVCVCVGARALLSVCDNCVCFIDVIKCELHILSVFERMMLHFLGHPFT